MIKFIFSGILLICLAGFVEICTAELIPQDYLPPAGIFETAGVEGGIPERHTIFADVTKPPYNADNTGTASAVAAIRSAINDCPSGQVVFVPKGRYLIDQYEWDTRIAIKKPVTLRGAGPETVFYVTSYCAVGIGGLGPWPPPKANPTYYMPVLSGAVRGSGSVQVADTSLLEVGKMIMVDEVDDPSLVWTKNGSIGRYRGSMHLVESKTANSVTFRPVLPINYTRSPQLSRHPDFTQNAGIENIKFVGTGTNPGHFIHIVSAWNVWVYGCEFTAMPSKTITVGWSGHVEIRGNFLHHQSNGGPNSEAIDLANDTNWSAVIDNICVAAGYPQINIGDMGANPYYSGGFGNVIAYNYCNDSFYTDPPTSTNHWMMTIDIGTNHSPHPQYNLVEGNIMGKFGVDAYHGSGSHTILFRNIMLARNCWEHAVYRTAVQIDRRNLFYVLIGNVLGETQTPANYEYVETSSWPSSAVAIYRLGFPNVGNQAFSGTYPPDPILNADGGPRDLYVGRDNTEHGTAIIEGNWNSASGRQDWSVTPEPLPDSLFLKSKPAWFGSLHWPPINPQNPNTNDITIIPAGYRYIHSQTSSTPPSRPVGLQVR